MGIIKFIIRLYESTNAENSCKLTFYKVLSYVAEENGKIVGIILSGNDGLRGCIYHMTVDENFRKQKIGSQLKKMFICIKI